MDCIRLEFNDIIISLYKKNDSERRRFEKLLKTVDALKYTQVTDIWENIVKFTEEHSIELQVLTEMSNKRKRFEPASPRNFVLTTTTGDENEDFQSETNVKDYWKTHAYYIIIDEVVNNMKTRFSSESLQLAVAIDYFYDLDYEKSLLFIQQYKDLLKIDLASLKMEMMAAKNCLEKDEGPETKNQISSYQKCIKVETFPNLYKLLNLALSIPISSASRERSFSTMRRINTYIRSTMSHDRFSSVAIINIEKDVSNSIDSDDILEIYSKENRRLIL